MSLLRRAARANSVAARRTPRAGSRTVWFGGLFGLGLLATAIGGFWVAADVSRYADFSNLGPGGTKLRIAVVVLSWLVLFGPFFYFGVVLLHRSFSSEKRSWLIPLRVFTYLVGRRFSVEKQRQEFFRNLPRKPLPSAASQVPLKCPGVASLTKNEHSGSSE